MSSRRLAALAVVLVATACVDAPDVARRDRAIIGGTVTNGDHAVVGLVGNDGVLLCSGTLVSPRVVVSAAHCLEDGGIKAVYFGADSAMDGGEEVPVGMQYAHPAYDGNAVVNDISILVLTDDPPDGVLPVPWSKAPLAVGTQLRHVGYGFTGLSQTGDYGRKYQVTAPVTQVDATAFGYGIATCNGDSGGPAFRSLGGREYLAGITSWGDDACAEFGVDTRVDAFAPWLVEQVGAVDDPTCAPDGQCARGCDGIDIDCPCEADGQCTSACAGAELDVDCPAGCAADGACLADCPTRDPDCQAIAVGGACDSSAGCEGGVCEDGLCRALCTPGLEAACTGFDCVSLDSGVYACAPEPEGGGCGCRVGGGAAGAGGGGGPAAGLLLLALGLGLGLGFRARRG